MKKRFFYSCLCLIIVMLGCSGSSDDTPLQTSTNSTSQAESINYRQLAANYHSVSESNLTDAQLVSFFNQFFITSAQNISDSFACNDSRYFRYTRTGVSSYSSGNGSYNVSYTGVSLSIDSDYLVISSQGYPNHQSYFFYNAESSPVCMFSMGNTINDKDIVMKIPLSPTVASSPTNTTMSVIGLASNGVAFFDGYSANTNNVWSLSSDAFDQESETFDQTLGHPEQSGTYHYHVDTTYSGAISSSSPIYYTSINPVETDRSKLLGFMRDGFPVFGPEENNSTVSDSDLDSCRGHVGQTAEFGNVYHYHVKALETITENTEDAYIIGCFSGTVGPAVTTN